MSLPLRIEVIEGTTVEIEWDDGEMSVLDARTLRGACMCAGCREGAGEQATAAVLAGPAPITIQAASLVGGYAITFTFGPDAHATGIFPYTALRTLAADPEPGPED